MWYYLSLLLTVVDFVLMNRVGEVLESGRSSTGWDKKRLVPNLKAISRQQNSKLPSVGVRRYCLPLLSSQTY